MRIHELITDTAQIVTDLQATDRWATIDELIGVLAAAGRIRTGDTAAVAAAVREREESMSTGIGHGIGIPHAPTDHVKTIEAVLGIAQHDVNFEALDGQPVRIVMLFIVPKNEFRAHLDTLANIARVLGDEAIRQRLRAATTPEQALAIIRETGVT